MIETAKRLECSKSRTSAIVTAYTIGGKTVSSIKNCGRKSKKTDKNIRMFKVIGAEKVFKREL